MAAPTKLTDEVRVKLQQAAAMDCNITEMASYCGISRETLYSWLEKDKELSDEIERLREKPVLLARATVVEKLGDSYQNAMDYLKRKRKAEFGDSSSLDVKGTLEQEVTIVSSEAKAIKKKFEEELKKSIIPNETK